MTNPYTLLRKISKFSDCYKLLGDHKDVKTATMLRRLAADPAPSVRRFSEGLEKLTRPGYDSMTYLNAAYAGLEGMLKSLLNTIPSPNLTGVPMWDRLVTSRKIPQLGIVKTEPDRSIADTYTSDLIKLREDSILAQITMAQAFISYYKRAEEKLASVPGTTPSSPGEIYDSAVLGFYRDKAEYRCPPAAQAELIDGFKKSVVGVLTVNAVTRQGFAGMSSFAMMLNLISSTHISSMRAVDRSALVDLIDNVVRYRNHVAHGLYFRNELEEQTEDDRESARERGRRRIDHHNEAVANLLTLLIILLGGDEKSSPGFIDLVAYRSKDSLTYYPQVASFGMMSGLKRLAEGSQRLLVTASCVALVIGALSWNLVWGVDVDKFTTPAEKLEIIDAMIDNDTERVKRLRDSHEDKLYTDHIERARSSRKAADTYWDAREKDIEPVGSKTGFRMDATPAIFYQPHATVLDSYSKTQLKTFVRTLAQKGKGHQFSVGVYAGANKSELSRNPEIEAQRLENLLSYLRGLSAPNVRFEAADTRRSGNEVYLFVVF